MSAGYSDGRVCCVFKHKEEEEEEEGEEEEEKQEAAAATRDHRTAPVKSIEKCNKC